MFDQSKEFSQADQRKTQCSEKRMQKCASVTDITSMRTRRRQRNVQQVELTRKSMIMEKPAAQMNQFLFCLKLKMIGINRLFDNEDISSPRVANEEDANEILNELSKKIRNYQKETARRLAEQKNKNKSLEIKVINFEAEIKNVRSELEFQKKQQDKNQKILSNDIKKLQAKLKQYEKQKQLLDSKLTKCNQLIDQQTKALNDTQNKIKQLTRLSKSNEGDLFEKEKQLARIAHESKLTITKHEKECDSLRSSIMKKTQENNKLIREIENLKIAVDAKDAKLEEKRLSYNKLYGQLQKCEENLYKANQQHKNQLTKFQQHQRQTQAKIGCFIEQQSTISHKFDSLLNEITTRSQQFNTCMGKVQETIQYQVQLQQQIVKINEIVSSITQNMAVRLRSQEQLLREQLGIELQARIREVQLAHSQKVQQMEMHIEELETQLKRC